MARLTPDDKYHPVFTAVGCVRLMQLKRTDPESYALLGGLNRKLAQLKSDPEIVENLSAVKSLLEPYQYPACDIEESYSLVRLYGYTLSDVEDSKVRLRVIFCPSLYLCLGEVPLPCPVAGESLVSAQSAVYRAGGRPEDCAAGNPGHPGGGAPLSQVSVHLLKSIRVQNI